MTARARKSTKANEWVESKAEQSSPPLGRRKRLTIDMDAEAHRELKMHCAKNDRQIAEFVRELIARGISAT
ncbi:MAG: plasmid partition protein ParG [Fuerstiella sp.]